MVEEISSSTRWKRVFTSSESRVESTICKVPESLRLARESSPTRRSLSRRAASSAKLACATSR